MASGPFVEMTLDEFLERLGSEKPTPGGGSVAALVGALAAALGRMVAALSVGKPNDAGDEPRIRTLMARLARADGAFRALIDEDAAAYESLRAAFKLERTDPQRAERIAETAELAASVPLTTATLAAAVVHDLEELNTLSNPLLRSDAVAALHLARAALHAAAANVRANLPLVSAADAEELTRQLEAALASVAG